MKCYAYLDIETTGLSRKFSELTVIGVALVRGPEMLVEQMIGGDICAARLFDVLQGVDELYTYNGSRFDLPFIKAKLGVDLRQYTRHTDLMYHCWKQNLKGGLKAVERQLDIGRTLSEVNGYMAVRLWWQYINDGDERALETLLEYNREDVLNLQELRCKLGVA